MPIGTLKTKCSFALAANSGGISRDVEGAAFDLPATPPVSAPRLTAALWRGYGAIWGGMLSARLAR